MWEVKKERKSLIWPIRSTILVTMAIQLDTQWSFDWNNHDMDAQLNRWMFVVVTTNYVIFVSRKLGIKRHGFTLLVIISFSFHQLITGLNLTISILTIWINSFSTTNSSLKILLWIFESSVEKCSCQNQSSASLWWRSSWPPWFNHQHRGWFHINNSTVVQLGTKFSLQNQNHKSRILRFYSNSWSNNIWNLK